MLQPILVRFLQSYLEFERHDFGVIDYKTAQKLAKDRIAVIVNPDDKKKYNTKKGHYKTKVMYAED